MIKNAFLFDRLAIYLIIFELVVVLSWRIPVLIMAHSTTLTPMLHMIKKQEAAINRLYRKYLFNGGKNVYIKPIVI